MDEPYIVLNDSPEGIDFQFFVKSHSVEFTECASGKIIEKAIDLETMVNYMQIACDLFRSLPLERREQFAGSVIAMIEFMAIHPSRMAELFPHLVPAMQVAGLETFPPSLH